MDWVSINIGCKAIPCNLIQHFRAIRAAKYASHALAEKNKIANLHFKENAVRSIVDEIGFERCRLDLAVRCIVLSFPPNSEVSCEDIHIALE